MHQPRRSLVILAVILTVLVAVAWTVAPPVLSGPETTQQSCRHDDVPCAENLLVVERGGLRCAVYQAGGPNSARLWCEDPGRPGAGGPAAGGS